MPKRARHVEVPLRDLKYMALFRCEHPERRCLSPGNVRAVCNSCWAAAWSKAQLRNHKERSKLKTEEGHEAG